MDTLIWLERKKHGYVKLKEQPVRAFAKFPVSFWARSTTKTIRDTDTRALLIAIYLQTNTHSNMIGVYHLPLPYITVDTGIGYDDILEIMDKLIDLDFCEYDDGHEYVWIKKFAEDQTGLNLKDGDKRVKAIYKLLGNMPELNFKDKFYERYESHYHLGNKVQEVDRLVGIYNSSKQE